MKKAKNMNNYETMLRLCMIGVLVFTVLAAFSAFGWKYYNLKIKENEKSNQEPTQTIQNVYNINGDFVSGSKKDVVIEKPVEKIKTPTVKEKPKPNLSETILDIGNINGKPNPHFKYVNNEMDFQFTVNAVGNSIGHVLQTTFTLINTDDNRKPIDFKIFRMKNLNKENLIYKEKLLSFGQQVGNLTEPLLNTLYVVLDVKYTNEARTFEKNLRKIYQIKSDYVLKRLPETTADEFEMISEFLKNKKNTLGQKFKT